MLNRRSQERTLPVWVQAAVTLPTSHTGPLPVATGAGAHFHPSPPAEKTALKPVRPLLRALRKPSFMPLPSGSPLPHPTRQGSPVLEIWVPRQLLLPRDPGFPKQKPCHGPSSWRFILTGGQFGEGTSRGWETIPTFRQGAGLRLGLPGIGQGGGTRSRGGSLYGGGGSLTPTGLLPPASS